MSMTSALTNALSGMRASSRMAEVVSSNLSNALTEGYGRRSVELMSVQVGRNGGGVDVVNINRFVDAGLLADRRLADAALSGHDRSAAMLTRLENMIGGPDDASGLSAKLAQFEQALISASSDPASQTRLETVVSRLVGVTDTLNAQSRNIQSLRQDADGAIARDIKSLNSGLEKVYALNADILRLSGSGNDTSALIDMRQGVVDEIANIVPIRQIARDDGTIGLMTTNGTTLLDARPVSFGFDHTATITPNMTFASGALAGLTANGVALDTVAGIGRLDGGSLGAAFALRDETLPQMQDALDTIAADLIARYQDPDTDPTLTAGDAGLLTDQNGTLDLSNLSGLAGRISVNAAVNPSSGGDPTLLRDGINATTSGPTGSATQLNNWISALSDPRSDVSGTHTQSAPSRIADFISDIGAVRLAADENLSFAAARWDTLHQAELADGVDTDVELQNLLQIEQAYAANAKVIQTVDFMMQRLLEI